MTPNFRELDPSKTGKYVRWMEKNYKTSHDLDRLKNVVNLFDRFGGTLKVRDIYQWKLDDLETELQNRPVKNSKLAKAQKIVETDQFMLIRVDNLAAAKVYGNGTKWCISSKRNNKFHDYLLGGDLFYILINRQTQTKVCFQLDSLWVGKAKWPSHKYHHQVRRQREILKESSTWSEKNHVVSRNGTFGYDAKNLYLGQWLECAVKDGFRLRNAGTHPSSIFQLKKFTSIKQNIDTITAMLKSCSSCSDDDIFEFFWIQVQEGDKGWHKPYKFLVSLYNAGRKSIVRKIILKFMAENDTDYIGQIISQIARNKAKIPNYSEVLMEITKAL